MENLFKLSEQLQNDDDKAKYIIDARANGITKLTQQQLLLVIRKELADAKVKADMLNLPLHVFLIREYNARHNN